MTSPSFTPAVNLMPAKIIYGLMGAGFFIPVLPTLAGVIYAYVARGTDAIADSHFNFQIRTFWVGLVLSVICIVASATVVGIMIAIPVGLLALVWVLVRLISGIILALRDEPITSVGAMGFVAR
ncbi:hypothetical protein [Roseovarius sp. MBR-6]|jgi:uncharacterized membrane protein|uniref:DUF4870 family protein n=1 Tax=Roseovarius sp. MBR-6 TaxID=3156459 RepID=UPI0033994D30